MSQGNGVIKAYWNHMHKHTLSLTDEHCKQMRTAQAVRTWFLQLGLFNCEPSPEGTHPWFRCGLDTKRQYTLATETVQRDECVFRSLSFVSPSQIIASHH